MMSHFLSNETLPHRSLVYCLDRTYLNETWGGPAFVYSRFAADIVFTICILFVNTFLTVSIFVYRKKFRGTRKLYHSGTSMKFVQVLAISDTFVGMSAPGYLIPHYFCDINDVMRGNVNICMGKYVFTTFAAMMSNLSLISIAVDRYMAVECTLKYRVYMTHRVCHIIIACQILFSLVTSSMLFIWNHWTPDSFCDLEEVVPSTYVIILGTICHFTILVLVIGVHYKLHQKAAEYASRRSIISDPGVSRCSSINVKSAKVFILVAGVYFICWTPYSICLIIRVLINYPSPLFEFIFQITFSLSYANSIINPFIYAWKNTEIQNALIWSLKRISLN